MQENQPYQRIRVQSCPPHGLIYFPWSHPRRPGRSAASYIQFLRSWKLPRQVAIHIEVLAVLNIEFMKPLAGYRRGVLKFERADKWIFHLGGELRVLWNRIGKFGRENRFFFSLWNLWFSNWDEIFLWSFTMLNRFCYYNTQFLLKYQK